MNESPDFAEVIELYEDGVSLRLDGEDAPTQKHYQVLRTYFPKKGDRVFVVHVSGTILVLGPVGSPQREGMIPYADEAGHADTAQSANTLGGKSESSLSVNYAKTAGSAATATKAINADNATSLNGRSESSLSVNYAKSAGDASTADSAANASYATSAGNSSKLNSKMESELSVKNFTGRHTGSTIAFFDETASYQKSVSGLSTSATPEQVRAKLIDIYNALHGYGLI